MDITELTFNQVILNHIDRMSKLVNLINGEVHTTGGHILVNKEEEKENAFFWAIDFFQHILPEDEVPTLKKQLEKITDKDLKKQYMRKLGILINLCNKKGWLRRGYGVGIPDKFVSSVHTKNPRPNDKEE
jgi:hypothetical protein